jgi:hypothetical protein
MQVTEQSDDLKGRPKVFIGRDRYQDFMREVSTIEGPACSPGTAAAELAVSRQYISKLVKTGKLTAVIYKQSANAKRADFVYIPVSEVREYAKKHGRGQPEDFAEETEEFG